MASTWSSCRPWGKDVTSSMNLSRNEASFWIRIRPARYFRSVDGFAGLGIARDYRDGSGPVPFLQLRQERRPIRRFFDENGRAGVVPGKTFGLFQQLVKIAPLADLLDQELVVAIRGPHLHDAVASLRPSSVPGSILIKCGKLRTASSSYDGKCSAVSAGRDCASTSCW